MTTYSLSATSIRKHLENLQAVPAIHAWLDHGRNAKSRLSRFKRLGKALPKSKPKLDCGSDPNLLWVNRADTLEEYDYKGRFMRSWSGYYGSYDTGETVAKAVAVTLREFPKHLFFGIISYDDSTVMVHLDTATPLEGDSLGYHSDDYQSQADRLIFENHSTIERFAEECLAWEEICHYEGKLEDLRRYDLPNNRKRVLTTIEAIREGSGEKLIEVGYNALRSLLGERESIREEIAKVKEELSDRKRYMK